MNTPAHLVLNVVLLGRGRDTRAVVPIAAGALLPDLSMIAFYVLEKGFLGRPERRIWSEDYFAPAWQNLFDSFHSLPLFGLLLAAALLWRWRAAALLCASAMLHSACDLPLHHDDAHRHFFPLSDWRFHSPLSYWDPRFHGDLMAPLEGVAVLLGCALLLRRYPTRAARVAAAGVAGIYAIYVGYALWVWVWV